jgi:hypothetical protein
LAAPAPPSPAGAAVGGTAAGVAVAAAAAAAGVLVGGAVAVKVGRSSRVGSGVTIETCAPCGVPNKAVPTQ